MEVTFSHVSAVLQIAGSILKELSERFSGTTPCYELDGVNDYKDLLDLTSDGMRQREQEAGRANVWP